MVASALSAILGQRLVRMLCPNCKVAYRPNPAIAAGYACDAASAVAERRRVARPPAAAPTGALFSWSGNADASFPSERASIPGESGAAPALPRATFLLRPVGRLTPKKTQPFQLVPVIALAMVESEP